MSEELKTIQEASKAVQEASKTTSKALDSLNAASEFLKEVFGDLVQDSVGLMSDKLKFYRIERFYSLKEKTEKNLKEKGVKITIPVPPKIAIPLIESATIEDNDNLHTRWANMLSNAINPAYKNKITRNFISILEDMEPVDVLILDSLCKEWLSTSDDKKSKILFDRIKLTNFLKISTQECEISLRNLVRLGCLRPGSVEGSASFGGHYLSSYKDIELVGVTALGIEFYQAIKP